MCLPTPSEHKLTGGMLHSYIGYLLMVQRHRQLTLVQWAEAIMQDFFTFCADVLLEMTYTVAQGLWLGSLLA